MKDSNDQNSDNGKKCPDSDGLKVVSEADKSNKSSTVINYYLTVLKRTATKDMYGKYLELKEQYRYSPAFYMDTADYFMS